jgi:pimeloyl-ACP methyl ester carboxylesterase
LYLLSTAFVFSQTNITSEDLLLYNENIQLPGTLSYDKDQTQQPLAIFVQGSGNPDRNGNQLGFGVKANYIKQLRDKLNANGIGFYSYDKRNVTKSNIPLFIDDFSFEMLVEDVQIALSHFKSDQRFDEIILIGHSQGSLVAMLAIDENVDQYISIAGPAEPIDQTIIRQLNAQNPEFGKIAEQHFQELKETDSIANVNPFLVSIFSRVNQGFLVSYIQYNPSDAIKQVRTPTLIINGDKDLQVGASEAEKLHQNCSVSELKIIKNMNHVLKTIESDTDNQASYYSEEYPLSEDLVTTLVNFIKSK